MSRLRELPSIVWIFIFVGGIAAIIGGFIGLIYLLSHVEGVGSVIMIAVAWGILRFFSPGPEQAAENPDQFKVGNLMKALFIFFFAAMGLAIDQTGNYLYNKPIEWLFCPSNMELERGVEISNPVPGETYITQEFACIDHSRERVEDLGLFKVLGVRFIEYILLGYGLIALNRLYTRLRARPPLAPSSNP